MIDNYHFCQTCPLFDRPTVLGKEYSHKKYMIVGESPAKEELIRKELGVGRWSQILWATLKAAGIRKHEVYMTSTVKCVPKDKQKPSSTSVEHCRDRLYEEILAVRPEKILLLGSISSRAILGQAVTKCRGLLTEMELNGHSAMIMATYNPSAINHDNDLFRDFAADIQKWALRDAPEPAPLYGVIIPTTPQEATDKLLEMLGASALSCDLETTGLNPREDRIISYGFGAMVTADPPSSINLIIEERLLAQDSKLDDLVKFTLSDWEGDIVFHNIKFDMSFLRTKWGRDLKPKHPWDTLLMRYAQDERGSEDNGAGRSYGSLGLKDIARVRYDIPDYHFDFESFFATPWELRDWERFYRYQALDTHTTIRLFFDLREELRDESPKLLDLVRDFLVPGALAFCNVELSGIPIDVPYLDDLGEETSGELMNLTDDLKRIVNKIEFNPNSPKQVKEFFTEANVPFTSGERTILQMMMKDASLPKEQKEFIPKLLDFRQMSKVLETYINGLLKRGRKTGIIHGDFRLHGTDTGRTSCRNPNLQNIPTIMGPKIKRAFIAPEGWKIINADYSQLELRVAAFLSRDEGLIEAFLRGVDIHRWVASFTFSKPLEEITSFERYMAKYVDFGILYGRSARGLTEGFEAEYIYEMTGKQMTNEWADDIQMKFFGAFPRLKEFIDNQHRFVRTNGYIEGPTGRRRRFPYIDDRGAGSVQRKSVNTPIQGFASDMTVNSIITLDRVLPYDRARTVSSVHDSIMFLLRDDYLEEGMKVIRQVMETPCIPEFDIPLKVDIGYGQDWSQAKD